MKPLKRTGLYQSLYLINVGTEMMLHGLHNWRCNPHLPGNHYQEVILDLQHRRILLNLQFLSEMQQREQVALDHLEEQIHNAAPKV